MKICLIASQKDVAGMNMYTHLKDDFVDENGTLIMKTSYATYELHAIKGDSTSAEHIDKQLGADLLIFLTKHASKSGIKSYSVHTQGNWALNDLGGNPKEVAPCPVILKHQFYLAMKTHNPEYEVVQEVTHHGPSVSVPSVFVEIGSALAEWEDPKNGEFMRHVILSVLRSYNGETSNKPVYFGLGGQHTCTNYERIVSSDDIILGHVCPTHKVLELDAQTIKHAYARHSIMPKILLDWKSLKGPQKQHLFVELEKAGLEYERLDHLKKKIDGK